MRRETLTALGTSFASFLVCLLLGCAWSPSTDWTEAHPERRLVGPYLGQTPPGREPALFAPGVVSTPEFHELNSVFSKNGRAFFFARRIGEAIKIFSSTQGRGAIWSAPRMVDFSRSNARWDEVDMWFTRDGQGLLYISNAPAPGFKDGSVNVWRVRRERNGWANPKVLPAPINSDGHEIYPMVVASGSLYFSSTREGGLGGRDLYVSDRRMGYAEPSNLGPPINSAADEGDVYVAPDESYLVVTSNREGGLGKADLYISFRNPDDTWGAPKNLGAPINSTGNDYCPVVTPDGRYFFFSRDGDVYWVDADVLESHRPGQRVARSRERSPKSRSDPTIRIVESLQSPAESWVWRPVARETANRSATFATRAGRTAQGPWLLRRGLAPFAHARPQVKRASAIRPPAEGQILWTAGSVPLN